MLYGFFANLLNLIGTLAILVIAGLILVVLWYAVLPRAGREIARFRAYRRRQLRETREALAEFDERHRDNLDDFDNILRRKDRS